MGTITASRTIRQLPRTTMTAQILNGLITLAIFLIPIPLLLWADRPRRQSPTVARVAKEG
jgi:hypothetical protein